MENSIRNLKSEPRGGFTLVELLIVIGIIVLLIGITIPVVGRVKSAAQEADTKGLIQALDGAIQNYYSNFKAYPGPIPDRLVYYQAATGTSFGFPGGFKITQSPGSGFDTSATNETNLHQNITGTENLVLGLLGGLKLNTSATPVALEYDPTLVGNGPASLNPANPKRYGALGDPNNLSWRTENGLKTGKFKDDTGTEATDTIIPEFVDKFSSGPMPILYLRARQGAKKTTAASVAPTIDDNGVINQWDQYDAPQQYDLAQVFGYTRPDTLGNSIGVGRVIKPGEYKNNPPGATPEQRPHGLRSVGVARTLDKSDVTNYQYPYDAYPYFQSPESPNTARNKDGFILISAGKDRVYGTNDDITNFGPVR
ncbi:MAG TPA: prepilin-type N-terminal cleavage/methylation domain-containing protein [Tepidisphaeraceae bacterium]|nr:prepilin-type N-terminal cleavage/methylation domain-containing protein [Tepidisphaeraceae bacterium]